MKNRLTFLFTALTSCAFAQKSFFGVDAGVNVATQRVVSPYPGSASSSIMFFNNVVKPTFGFFYQYRVSETIALRANAKYMSLGFSEPQTNSFNFTVKSNVDINYLTFPLTIHYHANKQLSLNAGTYLSFTLGGTDRANQDVTKTYHKNDFGFSLGAEYDIYKNFAIGMNYFMGTKNIWLNDQGGTFKHTNRALQFTLIYKFKKPI
jgi:hypothetical protein